jgi:hypothetical protein
MALTHEEYRSFIPTGLSVIVERLDSVIGNSNWRASATNAATLKDLIRQQSLLVSPLDAAGFQTAIRQIDYQYNFGILTDAGVAAMNDQATSRDVFESQDQVLKGSNNGAPHRWGSTR